MSAGTRSTASATLRTPKMSTEKHMFVQILDQPRFAEVEICDWSLPQGFRQTALPLWRYRARLSRASQGPQLCNSRTTIRMQPEMAELYTSRSIPSEYLPDFV